MWTCQCSVDVDVPVAFAWRYMTDVSNWSDPPAEFALEGPFAVGTRGTTRIPGQPTRAWMVYQVTPERAYTIHGSLAENAFILFHWQFNPLSASQTTGAPVSPGVAITASPTTELPALGALALPRPPRTAAAQKATANAVAASPGSPFERELESLPAIGCACVLACCCQMNGKRRAGRDGSTGG